MKLSLLIKLNLKVPNKDELFSIIAKDLNKKGYILSESDFINHLNIRENEISTGIGKGVAFPHAKLETIKPFIYFVRLADPIDFNALDGKPCNLFFFVGARKDMPNSHLKLLAASAMAITDNKDLIQKSSSVRKIRKFLLNYYKPHVYFESLNKEQLKIIKKYQKEIIITNDKTSNLTIDLSGLSGNDLDNKLANLEGIK